MSRSIADIAIPIDDRVTESVPGPDGGPDTGGEALRTWALSVGIGKPAHIVVTNSPPELVAGADHAEVERRDDSVQHLFQGQGSSWRVTFSAVCRQGEDVGDVPSLWRTGRRPAAHGVGGVLQARFRDVS
ncbi:hypothetical protein [Streptomyces sp. NPDC021139]|uniref:hypothetical protein n=1 Tax=unclassified Streptomyces TaxID=2593676 RepID=UPI00340BBBDB